MLPSNPIQIWLSSFLPWTRGKHGKIRNLATAISLIMKVIFNDSSDVMMTPLLKKETGTIRHLESTILN